jgi:hypothetical protein
MDSMDDEMYLEYLFSQGLADSLEKTISEIPTISCENHSNLNAFQLTQNDCLVPEKNVVNLFAQVKNSLLV